MALPKPGLPTVSRSGTVVTFTSPAVAGAEKYVYQITTKPVGGEWSGWSSGNWPFGLIKSGRSYSKDFQYGPGTEVGIRFKAVKESVYGGYSDESPYSETLQYTVPSRPTAPHGLTASKASLTQINTAWDGAGDGGAALIEYEVALMSSGWTVERHLQGFRSRAFTELSPGGTYSVQVRARNDFGWSPYSSTPPIRMAAAPDTITAVTLTRAGVASWAAPADNGAPITAYEYQVWDGYVWGPLKSNGTALSLTISGRVPGVGYRVRVRAKNAAGTSGWRESATVTSDRCTCT